MSEQILEKIVRGKKVRVEDKKREVPLAVLEDRIKERVVVSRDFKKAISKPDGIALIAEMKKVSPSAGVLREDFDPVRIAKEYEVGADAISVLTEEDFFKGSLDILAKVKAVTSKPVLAKDFFIDEYQIYEAKLSGADCILLIVRILDEDTLSNFLQISRGLGMDCLVEVHNEAEVRKAIGSGSDIIGINNRNLENFKVDLKLTEKLSGMIPEDKLIVSESGINTRADVEFLISLGVDAILVGEAFMRSGDISAKVRELLGIDKS
jgi:indole-3-glycerol phosphate synthase